MNTPLDNQHLHLLLDRNFNQLLGNVVSKGIYNQSLPGDQRLLDLLRTNTSTISSAKSINGSSTFSATLWPWGRGETSAKGWTLLLAPPGALRRLMVCTRASRRGRRAADTRPSHQTRKV